MERPTLTVQQPTTTLTSTQAPITVLTMRVLAPIPTQILPTPVQSQRTRPPRKVSQRAATQTSSSPAPKDTSSAEDCSGADEDDGDDDLIVPLLFQSETVAENLPISPNDDFHSYADLIWKMALRLGIPTSQPSPPVKDVIFEVLQACSSSVLALPISRVLLDSVKTSWSKPALVPVSNKKMDHVYRTQDSGAEFLATHPKPNSVEVSSSSKSRRQQSMPPDREG